MAITVLLSLEKQQCEAMSGLISVICQHRNDECRVWAGLWYPHCEWSTSHQSATHFPPLLSNNYPWTGKQPPSNSHPSSWEPTSCQTHCYPTSVTHLMFLLWLLWSVRHQSADSIVSITLACLYSYHWLVTHLTQFVFMSRDKDFREFWNHWLT